MKREIFDIADSLNLNVIETCDNAQGYPSGIDKGIIGFNTFKEAEKFIIEHAKGNAITVMFKKRDGHHFWQNVGWKRTSFTYNDYLNDLGDNYREFDFEQEFKAAVEMITYNDDYTLEDLKNLVDRFEILNDEFEQLEGHETLIFDGSNVERVNKEMMSYSEDVYTYAIGVYVEL